MSRYYYDLHTHSCLSPCADDDNTPNNLLGMASLAGIDILALTDHNTTKNCPAFFEASVKYGIIPVAGMELTTSEDIHLVCLFETLQSAMQFGELVEENRNLFLNRPDIFGEQLILDSEDNVIGKEEYLLSNATNISIEDAPKLAWRFGGVVFPAHIDREANGIIATLGTFPDTPHFDVVEFRDGDKVTEYVEKYGLYGKKIVVDSDAHYLTGIRDKEHYIDLDCDGSADSVRGQLIKYLRCL